MSEESEVTPVKRRPGRPRKNLEAKVEAKTQAKKPMMRAKPNWEEIDADSEVQVDRYRLPAEFLAKHKDWSFQFVTDTVLGQPDPQHRGVFEKGGWTPVHQEDFDGELNGMFMKKGDAAEINVGGQVLMARPAHLTAKARAADERAARQQVLIKEQALRGGDFPDVTLDSQHPSALRTNRISKSIERIDIPDK